VPHCGPTLDPPAEGVIDPTIPDGPLELKEHWACVNIPRKRHVGARDWVDDAQSGLEIVAMHSLQ